MDDFGLVTITFDPSLDEDDQINVVTDYDPIATIRLMLDAIDQVLMRDVEESETDDL